MKFTSVTVFFLSALVGASARKGGKKKSDCVTGIVTSFGQFFAPASPISVFGVDNVCKGSGTSCTNAAAVGTSQGFCVTSAGPATSQSQVCKVAMTIAGDLIIFEYVYPSSNPTRYGVLVTAGTGCYEDAVGTTIPVLQTTIGANRRFSYDLDFQQGAFGLLQLPENWAVDLNENEKQRRVKERTKTRFLQSVLGQYFVFVR